MCVHLKQRADCINYMNQWPKGDNLLLRCTVKSSYLGDHSAAICQQLELEGLSAKVACYCRMKYDQYRQFFQHYIIYLVLLVGGVLVFFC